MSAPAPPSKILSPAFPLSVSLPEPPYKLSFVLVFVSAPARSLPLATNMSLPPLPFIVSVPRPPLIVFALLSPFKVPSLSPPLKFSKLVAFAVVNESVVPAAGELSPKDKVSIPAPPSSLVMLALPRAGVPLVPVSMTETLSSPAPISILSASFNLAELRESLPPLRSIVQLPV